MAALCAFFALAATSFADAPPVVTIEAPTAVGYTRAHVSGTVNPSGGPSPTAWHFEYSTDPNDPFSWNFAFSAFGEFSGADAEATSPSPVEGDLEGLQPGTEYSVRLVAENGEFTNHSETGPPYPTFTTEPVAAPSVTIDAPTAVTATSAHFEGDIESPGTDPAFAVSWHFQCEPDCPGLEGTLPAEPGSHHVSADATGLQPGAAYEVSLIATNAGGAGSAGPESFSTITAAPSATGLAAYPQSTEAKLRAQINPGGLATTYRFEYGPTAGYGQSTATVALPAGGLPVTVEAELLGLSPSTIYHYRLVAANATETVTSDDRQFTTQVAAPAVDPCPNAAARQRQGASYLPDCRAFELASGTDLNLADVNRAPIASDDGESVAFMSLGNGYEDTASVTTASTRVARRTASGWQNENADLPVIRSAGLEVNNPVAFSPDLGRELVSAFAPSDPEDQDSGGQDIYGLDLTTDLHTWVSRPEEAPDRNGPNVYFAGASSDLSRVTLMTTEGPLFAAAPYKALYLNDEAGTRVISLLPDETPVEEPMIAAFAASRRFGDSLESFAMAAAHGGRHAVSDDGRRVYFYGKESESQPAPRLYLRDDERTVAVSASRRSGDLGTTYPARFIAASHDGSIAFFESEAQLTDDAPTSGGIYRFDLATGTLTVVVAAADAEALNLIGAIAADDMSRVYFTSGAALTAGATPGSPNVYLYAGGEVTFVANLVDFGGAVARVSRDGRFAVLRTTASLAGADADGHVTLYEYDAVAERLTCASCRADGAASQGDANLGEGFGEQLPGLLQPTYTSARIVADDGTVFFATKDRLVSRDVTPAADIYQYRDGSVHLISSGRSDDDAYIADNSDDGRSVFFTTRAALAPSDVDGELADLYVARAGGGLPEPPPPLAGCGDDCQRPGTGAPPPPIRTQALTAGNVKKRAHRKARKRHQKARKRHHQTEKRHHQAGGRHPDGGAAKHGRGR